MIHPDFDKVFLDLGFFQIRWYGIAYLAGFVCFLLLGRLRAKKHSNWQAEEMADLLYYGALGVIIGGRLGYVFFYAFDQFLNDPLMLFKVWEGGMAYHGGLLGVIAAMAWYARKTRRTPFQVLDFIAPLTPVGLGLVRLANFVNAELVGRPTDLPWGMVFPYHDDLSRHPSQLYQAFLEGVVLFLALWFFSRKARPVGAVSGLFLLLYGSFRILVEFVRQPDAHMGDMGFVAFGWLTQGQLLSLPMVLIGLYLIFRAYRGAASR